MRQIRGEGERKRGKKDKLAPEKHQRKKETRNKISNIADKDSIER
jgi:hypothetical protein